MKNLPNRKFQLAIVMISMVLFYSCASSSKLMKAASAGDKAYFDNLSSDADINLQDKNGLTALMVACQKGNKEIVEKLLLKGANPNLKDNQLNTALHFATETGSQEIVRMLINKKASITSNMNDITPLHIATKKVSGNKEIVLLLINNGATINQKSKITGETPFINALNTGNLELINLLVLNGANIADRDKNNVTTLMLAAKSALPQLVKEISEMGIDPNERSKLGTTALHYAAMGGNQEIIEFLISKGCDLSLKTNESETVIGYAVLSKKPDVVKTFLNYKADVNARCIKNYTPLMYALKNNDHEMVELLLSHEADVNLCGTDLASPISIAVSIKNLEFAELLKQYGCKLNLFTEAGFYPIKMGIDRQCDDKFMNVIYDCETNYATSLSLIDRLQISNSDSLKSLKNDITKLMTKSMEEIDNRKSEYSKKIAAKTAKNIGMALLATAASTASYVAASPGGMYNVYNSNWESNEFNRAVHKSLKNRFEFLGNKILEFQPVN